MKRLRSVATKIRTTTLTAASMKTLTAVWTNVIDRIAIVTVVTSTGITNTGTSIIITTTTTALVTDPDMAPHTALGTDRITALDTTTTTDREISAQATITARTKIATATSAPRNPDRAV